MPLPDIALIAVASLFALMGTGALFRPDVVTRQFGVPALTPSGRNEVRAVYGGFGAAMAAMLLSTLHAPALRAGAALTLAIALFGMAAGRIVSALIDRRIDRAPIFYLLIELVAGAALVCAA